MKAFVTGGTGFIGRPLVRKLVEKGYKVTALVRSASGAAMMEAFGARPVLGAIEERESMRQEMTGCDLVFHAAGWYKIGDPDWRQAEISNATGTRNVLELAVELKIPRIIYISTVAVYGDTHRQMVDESYRMPAGPFRTTYDRTKWLAHYQVAVPLIETGAPIIIACPGAIYGPGDTSLVGDLMRRFVAGQFPIFPAPDLTLTYTYVEDLADGLILAAEKGIPGETYNFTGPALPLGEMVKIWAELTGKRAPYLYAPAAILKPLGPLMGLIGSIIPLSSFFNPESISILDVAYTASNAKARRELGWAPQPIRLGMRETMAWFVGQDQPQIRLARKRKTIPILALASAGVLFIYWLAYRRKR